MLIFGAAYGFDLSSRVSCHERLGVAWHGKVLRDRSLEFRLTGADVPKKGRQEA